MLDLPVLRELNLLSLTLRILLAAVIGGFLGLDRERKGRAAGFRTYMLGSMGAAITMILSQYLDLMLSTAWSDAFETVGRRTDVVRLGARVISGIGFLGTGTILITSRNEIQGVTTASCLWASACMGLAIGAGFYECVIAGFLLIVFSIRFLPRLERWVLAKSRNMNIFVEMDSVVHLGAVINRMKAGGLVLYDVEIEKSRAGGGRLSGTFTVRLDQRQQHAELLAKLSSLEGVLAVEEV